MKKTLLLIVFTVFLLLSSVIAADFTLTTPNSVSLNKASSGSSQFNIQNSNETINNVQISTNSTSDLSDGSRTITITYNPSSFASILASATQTVNISISVPDNMKLGNYNAIIDVKSDTVSKSTNLDIRVDPKLCSDGKIGDLRIDIKEPDNNEDFKPGDKLNIEVDVKNEGGDDLDVKVEALLYNMNEGSKIVSVKSDELNIDNGEDETFNLELQIPYDDSDLDDENDDYILYIKAYESGDENDNCDYDDIDLNMNLEDDDVAVTKLTLTPEIVECGEQVTATVGVKNIGTDDQNDVRIDLKILGLNVNEVSNFFDLDRFGDSDDNHKETFLLTIPKNTTGKDYSVEALVRSDAPDHSKIETLKVVCAESQAITQETTKLAPSDLGILSIPSSIKSAAIGSTLPLSYAVTNPASNTQTYTVEFTPLGSWASPTSQIITVGPGQSSSFTLSIPISNSVAEGTYTASVKLLSSGNVIDTKSISVELLKPNIESQPNKFTGKTVLDDLKIGNIPLVFWLILDVILAALIVVMAILLLKK